VGDIIQESRATSSHYTRATSSESARWAASGVWESLFKTLADDPDNEYAMIDATIVRAHQHSAGARKKGATTKPSAAPAAVSRRKST